MKRNITLILTCLMLLIAQVSRASLPGNTQIRLSATANYTNSLNQTCSAQPASVLLTVQSVFGARIEWRMPDDKLETGKVIYIPLKITNAGNASDVFGLGVTSLLNWQTAIVTDPGRGGLQPGSTENTIEEINLAGGEALSCLLRVTIPANATKGDLLTVKALSRVNPVSGSASQQIQLDKPTPKSTSLSVKAEPASLVLGQKVSIKGSMDTAITDSVTVTITDPEKKITTYTCKPGTDGTFLKELVTAKAGDYSVDAKVAATSTHAEGSSHATFNVAKTQSGIVLTATPAAPGVNETVTFNGSFSPVSVVSIEASYQTPSGTVKTVSTKTDSSGKFSFSFTATETGNWNASAEFKGSATVASVKKQVTLEVHPAIQIMDHTLSFETSPTLGAAEVESGAETTCSAKAVDSAGDDVIYEWSDNSAGGSFSPSANVASPVYTAPINDANDAQTVTISCTAKCSADATISVSESSELSVKSSSAVPKVVSVMPAAGSNQTALTDDIVITFSKAMERDSVREALSFSPAVDATTYEWNNDSTVLTIRHDALRSNVNYDCTISTKAKDAGGTALAADYNWNFSTVPTFQFDQPETGANPSSVFSTPRLMMNDPLQPSYVSVKIAIPENLMVDGRLDNSGNLECVKRGSDVNILQSSYDEKNREITVSANVVNPSTSVEVVKAIRLAALSKSGAYKVKVQGVDALTVNIRKLDPGDFNGDGLVNMSDASLFLREWVRWRQESIPSYDADVDEKYDLAPHTEGLWPAWTLIGDHLIDAKDSAAFLSCWAEGHKVPSTSTDSGYARLTRANYTVNKPSLISMQVVVHSVVSGFFEAEVKIPVGTEFDPSLGNSGNLINVVKGQGAGGLFFSEYDAATKTVRLSGTTSGRAPYYVATVVLKRQN